VTKRQVPHNLEAESALLGAMVLNREAIPVAVERLDPSDFYSPAHAEIFSAIRSLYAAGDAVDVVTLVDRLTSGGVIDRIGGPQKVVEIIANVPSTSNPQKYAAIIKDRAVLRALIEAGSGIAEAAFESPTDVAALVSESERRILGISDTAVTADPQNLQTAFVDNFKRLEDLYDRGTEFHGTPTGFHDLDDILMGLAPSTFTVLGARPAMGKSALALAMADYVARVLRKPVLFFSLEMSRQELANRLLIMRTHVDSSRFKSGHLFANDWIAIADATKELADIPLYIDDDPSVTLMDIRGRARRLRAKHGEFGLIIIDYLQLMQQQGRAENRQVEVAEISRGLKVMAREMEAPVLGLSQLSRNLESRADKRPMLSDLRESGALEQDADAVLFIYRDVIYNPDTLDKGLAEVAVAKHRSGPTGLVRLGFIERYAKFVSLANFQ
jgi:replicative DNA helicase